jgi:3-hydroxyisobutyrate dehydrogenase-like beta-hydroxyacid dehydrogenase
MTQLNQLSTATSRLGFIGLGYMGSRLSKRLVEAGYSVSVYDRDDCKTDSAAAYGAAPAHDLRDLATGRDVILSCLADGATVERVYLGPGGVLEYARPGSLVIEMSTVTPETSQKLHLSAQTCGISALDVAISGSTPAVESGTLTLFGGGDLEVFNAAAPIFAAIARQWFYMGPAGSGVAMKLVVNALLGVGMQAIAEAVALGAKLGLPHDRLFDTLVKTAVVAPAHIGKIAAAKQDDYSPQFPVRLMRKDFALILSNSERLGVPMPVTREASKVMEIEAAYGREEDFSAVVKLIQQWTDDAVRPPA